jgi:hypothetical protein
VQNKLLWQKEDFDAKLLSKDFSDAQLDEDRKLHVSTYLLVKNQRELLKLSNDSNYRVEKIKDEQKTMLLKNISRWLLILVWLSIAFLVYKASVKRKLERRIEI